MSRLIWKSIGGMRRRYEAAAAKRLEEINSGNCNDNNSDDNVSGELSRSLDENIKMMDNLFMDVDTMLSRRFQNALGEKLDFCIYFSDGVVNSELINRGIIEPLLLSDKMNPGSNLFDDVKNSVVMMNDVKETTSVSEIVSSVTYGDTVLFAEGSAKALILSSKQFALRGVSEPEGEKVLSGPREGFTEGIMSNISMLRRRLRTNHLKLRMQAIGKQSNTSICICYMDNIVDKKLLDEVYRRLETINIDGVLDSNYITEHIGESSLLGFAATGGTERPDIAAAKILEGRIAIIVDGSPIVLTIPYLFVENFQSNEDYYVNPYYSSFSRMLRIFGFILAMITPALYLAVVSFHHEVLPAGLMINITAERQSVPLSDAVEAFVMLLAFDILRETGVRMPSHVGQALSIVGALVIGQAAVEAKLVASPMIIIVAFTGITSLLVPKLSAVSIITRYFFLLLASCFGMPGLICGISLVIIHILNLKSYGITSFTILDASTFQDIKDSFFRSGWRSMRTRKPSLSTNSVRSRPGTFSSPDTLSD